MLSSGPNDTVTLCARVSVVWAKSTTSDGRVDKLCMLCLQTPSSRPFAPVCGWIYTQQASNTYSNMRCAAHAAPHADWTTRRSILLCVKWQTCAAALPGMTESRSMFTLPHSYFLHARTHAHACTFHSCIRKHTPPSPTLISPSRPNCATRLYSAFCLPD
jgi:hypothetical protein